MSPCLPDLSFKLAVLCGVSQWPQRRRAEGGKLFRPIGYPGTLVGFGGMSVLDAAAVDREVIPWCVAGVAPGDGTCYGGRSGLVALMEQCLDSDPAKRPSLKDVQTTLRSISQQDRRPRKCQGLVP